MTAESTILEELRIIKGDAPTIDPEAVVAFAANPNTALHSQFEWDDSKAGHEFRLLQARQVIRVKYTVLDNGSGEQTPMRMFVSVREGGKAAGYMPTSEVINDDQRRAELVSALVRRIESIISNYPLPELQPIRNALKRVSVPKITQVA